MDKQYLAQTLSKNFKNLGNTYVLITSEYCSQETSSFKDMICFSMKHLPNNSGSIDDILEAMISCLGKQKVSEYTNSMILSYDDHKNKCAVKNLKQKI